MRDRSQLVFKPGLTSSSICSVIIDQPTAKTAARPRRRFENIAMSNTDNSNLVEPPYYELLTERLKLRTLRVSDAEAIMPILTSKEVMQWTVRRPRISFQITIDRHC